MNAFQYMKNASKGVAYASKEVWKKYNPTAAALASSAAQMGSELNQSIKNLKESAKGDDTYFKAGKEAGKEYVSNLLSDLKTGNWYNTQRQEEASNEMLKNMGFGDMMDFNMDFDMDDFGDDLDKSGVSETVKKQISSEQQSTKAMVTGMDVVGGKVSGALSTASAKSAQYIASVQMQTSKALYDLTSKGFAGVSVGIASINTNVTSLVEFTKPLSAHLQSVEEYNATSLNNQQKALELLKKISDNTTPVSATNDRKHKRNINDLVTGGVLDIGEYKEMLKEQFSIVTSLGSMFLGKDSLFSGLGMTKKGTINMALGTESPMLNILSGLMSLLMPKQLKKSSSNLDKVLSNLIPMIYTKLGKSNSMLGGLFKDFFMPNDDVKEKMNPGNFKRGKVDWDGDARQALTYVIPKYLANILSAISGNKKPAQYYNYNTGKFQTESEVKAGFKNIKDTYADSAGGDYIRSAENTINHMKISDEQKKNLKAALKQYNKNRFHKTANPMSGLSQDFVIYWDLYQKAQSSGNIAQYEGDLMRSRADYNNRVEGLEQSGSVYNNLVDGFEEIKETERATTLLGTDKDKHDIFFYLHGIYENTKNIEKVYDGIQNIGQNNENGRNRYRRNYNRRNSSTSSSSSNASSPLNEVNDEGPITLDAKSVEDALKRAESDDDYDASHTGDEKLDNYIRDRNANLIPEDPEMEHMIEMSGSIKGAIHKHLGPDSKIAKSIKSSDVKKVYDKLIKSVEGMASTPVNAMSGLLDAASNSITNVLLGTGKDGLKEWFTGKFVSAINKVKTDFLSSPLYKAMQDSFKKIKGGILGKVFSLFSFPKEKKAEGTVEGTAEEAKPTEGGEVPAGGATTKYNGSRYVSKTGVVAVSKGEMIIPAELNPFYRGKVNKNQQRNNELASIHDFYGSFADGTEAAGDTVKTDNNGNIEDKVRGAGKAVATGAKDAGGIFYRGIAYLVKSIMSVIGGLAPGNSGKAVDKEKKGISNVVQAALKDAGAAKGAVAAGAVIGGGASLLTGGLIGPILGASIGAATGLIVKSNAVQDALFGKIDEKTGERGGQETGGLLSKNMSNFMTKNLPDMGKGAGIGAVGGLFMGSPVMGAILGSAVGYVKSSDKAQDILFGKKDKKTGERADDGIIKKGLQDEIKKRIPGISAGAIAGMLAGPFGFAQNIIVGSVIGYAASGEKFKTWLLGKKDENGKRNGENSFVGLLKTNLIEPIVDIFANVGKQITQAISNKFNEIGKNIREHLLKRIGARIKSGHGLGSKILSKLPDTKTTLDKIGGFFKGVSNKVTNRSLAKGVNVFSSKLGRNLTATERSQARGDDYSTMYGAWDNVLRQAKSPEEIQAIMGALNLAEDPTKPYENKIISANRTTRSTLSDLKDVFGMKNTNKINSLIKNRQFKEARDLIESQKGLDPDKKKALLDSIDEQEQGWTGRNVSKKNAGSGIADLLTKGGLSDKKLLDKIRSGDYEMSDILNMKSTAKTEMNSEKFTKEGQKQAAITEVIPEYLHKILGVMLNDPETIDNLKNQYKKATGPVADAMNNEADKAKERLGNLDPDETEHIKDGTPRTNNGIKQIFHGGKWVDDNTDTKTKEILSKRAATFNAIGSIPVLGHSLEKISLGLYGIKNKLFGDKTTKEKGIFGKLFDFLSGENGPIKSIINWITGTPIGSAIKTALSKVTLGGVMTNLVAPALLAGGFAGMFDKVASKIGLGGVSDTTGKSLAGKILGDNDKMNYTDSQGNALATNKDGSLKTDANGNAMTINGTTVATSDVRFTRADKHSFSTALKYNTVRGLATGTASVASGIWGMTTKICNALAKLPIFKGAAKELSGMCDDVATKVTTKLMHGGFAQIAKSAKTFLVWAQVIFIATDFTTGYEDAATTMKIKEPTTFERVMAGLLRVFKNLIPVIGSLIPDETLVDVFVNWLAPFFGIDVKSFKEERAAAQKELDEYNQQNGTNMSWSEYNKSVRHDYTWTERIGNAAKSTWTQTKLKAGQAVKGIKEKGLIGYGKDVVSDMSNQFAEGYKQYGGGISGVAGGIGQVFSNMLPGIFGEFAQKNAQIGAFAAKGDIKSMWAVSLKDFSQQSKGEASVGIFSQAIGQIPLVINKVMCTPFAIVAKPVNDLLDKFKAGVDFIKNQATIAENIIKDPKGGFKEFMTIEEPGTDSPMNPFLKGVAITTRISTFVVMVFNKIGTSIWNALNTHVFQPIKSGITSMVDINNTFVGYMQKGDISSLWSYKYQAKEGSSLGPLGDIYTTTQKIGYLIPTGISWIGHKVGDGIKKQFGDVQSNITSFGTAVANIQKIAANGDIGGIWKNNTYNPKGLDPFSSVGHSLMLVIKGVFSISALLIKVGKPIGDMLSKAADWINKTFHISDFVDSAKTAVGGAVSGAANGIGGFFSNIYNAGKNFINGGSTAQASTATAAGGSGFISQNNPAYANAGFGGSTFGQLGCGPAAATMAMNAAGKHTSLGNAAGLAGMYQTGTGTDASYFSDIYGRNGMKANYYGGGSAGLINSIGSGTPTVLMGQDASNRSKANSPFGPNNHYVVASGFDGSGNLIINDPESRSGNKRYSSSILKNVKLGIGMSGGGAVDKVTGNNANSHKITTYTTGADRASRATTSATKKYNSSSSAVMSAAAKSAGCRDDSTTQAVWAFFTGKGYSEAATAGIMGNMQAESGIDPTRSQVGGPAKGIVQWENPRLSAMQNYASSIGQDWRSLNPQLQYVDKEIRALASVFWKPAGVANYSAYMKMTDPVQAADAFEKAYERAGTPRLDVREASAVYYYNTYTGSNYQYNESENSAVGSAASSATAATASTGTSTGSSTGSTGVAGILSTISSAFGKIGEIFTGSSSSTTENSSTGTAGTAATTTTGSIGSDESVSNIPNSTGASPIGRKAVAYMNSIKGTIPYSMTGARNPEKGSEDCSSSVEWAIKKAGGPDIGGYTGAQSKSKYLSTVWKGKQPSTLPANIKPGDVMFFTRKYSTNNPTYPDDIGHVGMYMGEGKLIDHGSGMGPKIKDMTSSSFINDSSYGLPTLRQVSRLYDAKDEGNYSNSADRASLAKTAAIAASGSGLIAQGDGGRLVGGASGLTPTAINNTKSKSPIMSKDTAALLKVIITLIESLVDNTKRNNDIYDIIKQYCGNAGAKGVAASAAVDALKSKSSGTDTVEKSLASLKTSIDEILAS